MSFYNLQNPADRARLRADRTAELEACRTGQWPRDINDAMRWIHATGTRKERAVYAARMCQFEIAALGDT